MMNVSSKKSGFTLVEALVVVSIMGILSSMGVASLRGAVIKAKIKDATLNTTAFLERVANEANKMSKTLCLKKFSDQVLGVSISDDCSNFPTNLDSLYDSFRIDAPAKFDCESEGVVGDLNSVDWTTGVLFEPRTGLSAAPSEGFVCIQYGSDELYGVAEKVKYKNMMFSMIYQDGVWNGL